MIARADSTSLLALSPQLSPAARQKNTMPLSGLLIGVGGGATKTVAAAYDVASEAISTGTAGPSNPESVGLEPAIDAIAAAGINKLAEQQRVPSGLPMVPP